MADNPLSTFLPDRAATGFFPQMKPRRRFQDREGSANLPLDVLRGRLAGMLGSPTDLANLLKSPMPTEMFGETNYEPAQQLPYGSEYFLKNLPLAPTSRVGEVAGQAGSFVPLNPMPAARAAQGHQLGRGAVALVFSQEAVIKLLSSRYMQTRIMDAVKGHRSIDGAVVSAMHLEGWTEYVHNPSLVQHTGEVSSMGNRKHPISKCYIDGYDPLTIP